MGEFHLGMDVNRGGSLPQKNQVTLLMHWPVLSGTRCSYYKMAPDFLELNRNIAKNLTII